MTHIQIFENHLKNAGYSVTKARKYVFTTLYGKEPLSIAELISLTSKEIDRASVYRTVDLFETLGIIQRLHIGWKYKIELSDSYHHHHHHMLCINCQKVVSLPEDSKLEAYISELAKNQHFTLVSHQIELQGTCKECKKHETPAVEARV